MVKYDIIMIINGNNLWIWQDNKIIYFYFHKIILFVCILISCDKQTTILAKT